MPGAHRTRSLAGSEESTQASHHRYAEHLHDAVLMAAPVDQLDRDIERMRAAMAKASGLVLDGFELRTDVNILRHPDRYQDPRGMTMWQRVMELISQREAGLCEVA